MARPQGRRPSDWRKIITEIENLDRVDASARFGFGDTIALASISGPIEARLGVELPSKAALEVILRPLSGIPGVTEKATITALRSVFAPAILLNVHPRTLIQVVFQALSSPSNQSYGRVQNKVTINTNLSMTAALINAGSLAFLQASSIPLVGIVVAVPLGVTQVGGSRTLIVDPEDAEIQSLVGGGVFAFLFSESHRPAEPSNGQSDRVMDGKLVWSSWDGVFDVVEVTKAEELAKQKGLEILQVFRQILSREELELDNKMTVD